MLTKSCYKFSTLSRSSLSWADFCVYPAFHWLSIKKNGTKNVKNEGMSRLYKWLSIEGRFKLSARYAMNYSFFFCFICYFVVLWLTYLVNSLFHLMLITGHWECCNKFGFLSQAKCLIWFEQRTSWFHCSTLTQYDALPKSVHGDCTSSTSHPLPHFFYS